MTTKSLLWDAMNGSLEIKLHMDGSARQNENIGLKNSVIKNVNRIRVKDKILFLGKLELLTNNPVADIFFSNTFQYFIQHVLIDRVP